MKKTFLGVALGVVLALSALYIGTRVEAQENRLRLEAADLRSGLRVVCDTGNGTLVYVIRSGSINGGVAVALQLNGCK